VLINSLLFRFVTFRIFFRTVYCVNYVAAKATYIRLL